MGLMVMQDMPSLTNEFYRRDRDPDVIGTSVDPSFQFAIQEADVCIQQILNRDEVLPKHLAEFTRQLAILVEQHKSYPSIVAWVS
jgi:beta-galactosidase/beta-glucuronidase